MRTIAASEAKARLLGLLDDVERGETIVVTRHGKAVARLVPETDARSGHVRETFARLDALKKSMPRIAIDDVLSAIREGRD